MRIALRPPLLTLLAVALALAGTGAWAQDRGQRSRDNDRPQQQMPQQDTRQQDNMRQDSMRQDSRRPRADGRDDSLADSVRRVERATRGQVLSAERMQSDGRDVNRIKVMDDRGRVRIYMDDPQRKAPTRDNDN